MSSGVLSASVGRACGRGLQLARVSASRRGAGSRTSPRAVSSRRGNASTLRQARRRHIGGTAYVVAAACPVWSEPELHGPRDRFAAALDLELAEDRRRRGGRPCAARGRAAPRSQRCEGPSATSCSTSTSRAVSAAAFARVDARGPRATRTPRSRRARATIAASGRGAERLQPVVRLPERVGRRLPPTGRAPARTAGRRLPGSGGGRQSPATLEATTDPASSAGGRSSTIPCFRRQ